MHDLSKWHGLTETAGTIPPKYPGGGQHARYGGQHRRFIQQVISLKNIADYGPFEVQDMGFTVEEFIEIRPYLIKLEDELSKPVRKQDVHLDYLPTQFLCEYIKSKGFDAIEYRSAMNADGYNLAIFNDEKLDCLGAKFYQVRSLKYQYS